jgi:nucleoside-diphosphate-sugar epimerase
VLRAHGFQVRGLVRPEDDLGRLELDAEHLYVGYVQDPELVRHAMRDVDAVAHCAALLPDALRLGPAAFRQVNVEGTRNVMRQAISSGVTWMVAMSTISVVDHITRTTTREGLFDYVGQSDDAYLSSKIDAEKVLLDLQSDFDGELAILRLAYVYGPGNFVVWRQPLRLLEQGKLRLVGHGAAPLPLIYADDIGRFVSALLSGQAPRQADHVHVLANPQPTTLRDVFRLAADQLGVRPPKSVPLWAAQLAAAGVSVLPSRLRRGRLELLTRARVLQFSRGYDLSSVLDEPTLEAIGLTDYRDGLTQMLADYVATERAATS